MIKRVSLILLYIAFFVLFAGRSAPLVFAKDNFATTIIPNAIYATGGDVLYIVYPYVPQTDMVGSLSITYVTDVAFDGTTLYGVTNSNLININPDTGSAVNIGSTGFGDVNGLALSPSGTLYGSTSGGALIQINKSSGAASLVGYFGSGLGSDGDIAFRNDGILFAAVQRPGYTTTWLAAVNASSGVATLIGDMGYPDVWGLTFLDGILYGGTTQGSIITINQWNGSSSLVFYDDTLSYWGLTTSIGSVTPPGVNWVKPVGNTQVYETSGGIVDLEVAVTQGTNPVDRVEFYWWDAVNQVYNWLDTDSSAPYQTSLDVGNLNMEWNQIDAWAFDNSGFYSGAYIWIYRTVPPPIAHFDAWPVAGDAPLDVEMHQYSEGVYDTCYWEYGDGTTGSSCEGYHWHTYTNPGLYSPSLTVSGPGGSDTQTIVDYIDVTSPQPNTYSIGGWVEDANANPIPDVTISNDQGHSTTTDQFGDFLFTGLSQGVYTLTPSKAGYTFDPPGVAVSVPPDALDISFVGTQDVSTYTISGWVLDPELNPVSGVKVATSVGSSMTNTAGWYTFSGLPAGVYTITASKTGYTFDPPSQAVSVPPSHDVINFHVKSIWILLRPNPDGYAFNNSIDWYSRFPLHPPWYDVTLDDLRKIYGDKAVCQSVTDGKCNMSYTAKKWYQNKIYWELVWGHCDGMATTAMRFFAGIADPSDLQSDAVSTYDLLFDKARRHISYFHILQDAPETAKAIRESMVQTPSVVLDKLKSWFADGAQGPFILHIAHKKRNSGHTLVPYALDYRGDDIWWIKVYDPNHSGKDTYYVEVNKKANTWKYTDLGFDGDSSTRTIQVVDISAYKEVQIKDCSYCVYPAPSWIPVNFFSTGGHLLITDGVGGSLGFQNGTFVDNLPNAYAVPYYGSSLRPQEPTYYLPTGGEYVINIDGDAEANFQDATVLKWGPGYSLGITHVLKPTTHDTLRFSGDGNSMVFNTAENTVVDFLLTDDQDASASWEFQVGDATVYPAWDASIANDRGSTNLVIYGISDSYGIAVSRMTASGEKTFYHADISISPNDKHIVDYDSWDTTRGTMRFYIDTAGDGTIDYTVWLNDQSYNTVFAPLVIRH